MDDAELADAGRRLARAVTEAVPAWVAACVERRMPAGPDGAAAAADTEEAGRRAAELVGARLDDLLGADIDRQSTTPLEVVRAAVRFPTAVLEARGVPPVRRDDFTTARFPEDVYDLSPANLAELGEEVGRLAIEWGAAKAMVHRRRHE